MKIAERPPKIRMNFIPERLLELLSPVKSRYGLWKFARRNTAVETQRKEYNEAPR